MEYKNESRGFKLSGEFIKTKNTRKARKALIQLVCNQEKSLSMKHLARNKITILITAISASDRLKISNAGRQ